MYTGKCFNTSHVTLYQESAHHCTLSTHVSIHLMLLFISYGNCKAKEVKWVSIHLMLLFICEISLITNRLLCFNTSHVTLYPFLVFVIREFISVSIHLMLLFIARRNDRRTVGYWVSIHLMLLFIWRWNRGKTPGRVSIHLMLLFIVSRIGSEAFFITFQYISCYSLSQIQLG